MNRKKLLTLIAVLVVLGLIIGLGFASGGGLQGLIKKYKGLPSDSATSRGNKSSGINIDSSPSSGNTGGGIDINPQDTDSTIEIGKEQKTDRRLDGQPGTDFKGSTDSSANINTGSLGTVKK